MPTNYNPDTDALETMQERFEREAEVDERIMRGELGKAAKTGEEVKVCCGEFETCSEMCVVRADRFKWQRDGHVEEIKLLKQQIDELLSKKFTRFANEECWIYQGDGEDHLESLVCPVVISASQLLQIEKQRDELLAATKDMPSGDELREVARYLESVVTDRDELLAALEQIVAANPRKWEELSEPQSEFERWAKSRANQAIASVKGSAA